MHRTEGDGFVIEGGKNRFKDQALPTYNGTVDTAEYNNAVQEEICNLIELLGGTVEPDAATDRTNAWRQLYEILLQSGKITNAAMSDFDLAKGFGEIETFDGFETLKAIPGEITLYTSDAGGVDDVSLRISSDHAHPGIEIQEETTGCTSKFFKGISFSGGPGEAAYDDMQYRKAGFAMHTGTFATPTVGTAHCNPNHTTDIPTTCAIISATIKYATPGNPFTAPAMLEFQASGNYWEVVGVMWTKRTGDAFPTGNNFDCIIEYDASSL